MARDPGTGNSRGHERYRTEVLEPVMGCRARAEQGGKRGATQAALLSYFPTLPLTQMGSESMENRNCHLVVPHCKPTYLPLEP